MNLDDVVVLLKRLKCDRVRPDSKSAWVNSTCPLAPWYHTSGVDNNPSFGVSVHTDTHSKFNCHSCGQSGDLKILIEKIAHHSGKDMSTLGNWVLTRDDTSTSYLRDKLHRVKLPYQDAVLPEIAGIVVSPRVARRITVAEPPPLPESDLLSMELPTDEVLAYLTGPRKLTEKTIEQWELRWSPQARRIAIPIRDVKGRLVGISGRAFDEGQKPKFLHSGGFRRDFYLYGELGCETGVPGYKTEGFFDVMYLRQKGLNAFAIMGSYLSAIQIEKCVKFFSRVVDVPDGDDAGAKGVVRAANDFRGKLPYVAAKAVEGKDPDQLTDEELDAIRLL